MLEKNLNKTKSTKININPKTRQAKLYIKCQTKAYFMNVLDASGKLVSNPNKCQLSLLKKDTRLSDISLLIRS